MPLSDCISVDDIRNHTVECQTVDLCCTDADIEIDLEIAYDMVKIITGTDWCPEQACHKYDGSGISKLFLHTRTTQPLRTLTTIVDVPCCGSTTDFTAVVNHGTYLEFPCDGCFPCGSNNITICGLWGKDMPAAIKKAVILLTLESVSPGSSGFVSDGNVKSATWEDFRIAYHDKATSNPNPQTTGYQEIDDLLKLYTNTMNDIHMVAVPQNDACTYRACGVSKRRPCC